MTDMMGGSASKRAAELDRRADMWTGERRLTCGDGGRGWALISLDAQVVLYVRPLEDRLRVGAIIGVREIIPIMQFFMMCVRCAYSSLIQRSSHE